MSRKIIDIFEKMSAKAVLPGALPAENLYRIRFGSQFRIPALFNALWAFQVFAIGFNFDSLIGTTNKCWFNVWLLTMAAMEIRLSLADSKAVKAFVEGTGNLIGMPSDVVWSDAVIHAFRAAKILPYLYDDSVDAGSPLMPATSDADWVFFRNWADGGHWIVTLPIASSLFARFAALAESVLASTPVARSPVSNESAADRELRMVTESSGIAADSSPGLGDDHELRKALEASVASAAVDEELRKALEASVASASAPVRTPEARQAASRKAAEDAEDEALQAALKASADEAASRAVGMLDATSRREKLVALILELQKLRAEVTDTEQRIARGEAELSKLTEKDLESIFAMTEVLDEHSHRLDRLKSAIGERLVEQAALRALKVPARTPVLQPAPARTPEARQAASRKAAEDAEEEALQAALKASADEAASLAEVERVQAEELERMRQIESDAAYAMTL